MSAFRILGEKAEAATVSPLQASLQEFIRISLDAKQLHWNVRGREFKPLHEQLDALADSARRWSDEVAERIVALGQAADGSAAVVAATNYAAVPGGAIAAQEAVSYVAGSLAEVAKRVRGRLEPVGESDLVSQDLLIGILAELEKHLWMFTVQI